LIHDLIRRFYCRLCWLVYHRKQLRHLHGGYPSWYGDISIFASNAGTSL